MGTPNLCLRLNRRPQALQKRQTSHAFFKKARFLVPQTLFTAEQVAADIFSKNGMFFVVMFVFVNIWSAFVNICQ